MRKPKITALILATNVSDLLSDPAKWCQGSNALTKAGEDCAPHILEADRFCIFGGMMHFTQSDDYSFVSPDHKDAYNEMVMALKDELESMTGFSDGVSAFNDTRPHNQVMDLINGAKAALEAKK